MLGLELQRIGKRFGGQSVVRDVSLSIPQGQFACFLGPSGCGKTTLLRMIAGLETPSSGRVLMNGKDVTHTPIHERNFSMVFQSLALFPHLSVAENIAYSLRLRGRDARSRDERVAELLKLIRLPDIADRPISALSGGQRQRVAIARALAQEPMLFLMDEPLSALDAKLRDHMQVELRLLQQSLKITTILVTHDQREAMTIADQIVVMGDGVVQQMGTPQEIYHQPANRFVASFIGQSNLFDAEVLDHRHVRLFDQAIPVARIPAGLTAGDKVTLAVRPEHVGFAAEGAGLPGHIKFVRDVGGSVEFRVDCHGQEIISTVIPAERGAFDRSSRVSLRFPPEACILLAS